MGEIGGALASFGYNFQKDASVAGGFAVDTRDAYKGWAMMQIFSPDNVGGILGLASAGGAPAREGVKKLSASVASTGSKASQAAGANSVYHSVENGVTEYVGITNNFARRSAEHLRQSGRIIEELTKNLSRADARAVEQALIEVHGLAKNGGTLTNRINSISVTNPAYAAQVKRGLEILKTTGN